MPSHYNNYHPGLPIQPSKSKHYIYTNVPAPLSPQDLFQDLGQAACFGLLGAAGANPDGPFWDLLNSLIGPGGADLFQQIFGDVPTRNSAAVVTQNQRLGFAGGALDDSFNAGVLVSKKPPPLSRSWASNERMETMRASGAKPEKVTPPRDRDFPPFQCFWTWVEA